MASVVDSIHWLGYVVQQVRTKKRLPLPKPMRRPGVGAAPDPGVSVVGRGGGLSVDELRSKLAAPRLASRPPETIGGA